MTTDTATTFTAANGRTFTMRLVAPGDSYGRDRVVLNPADGRLMVEFYDATYAGQDGFEPEGQICAQYYAATLMDDEERLVTYGLRLHGGVDAWRIDADSMGAFLTFMYRNM